jgi:lantibiotic modifying enzyme
VRSWGALLAEPERDRALDAARAVAALLLAAPEPSPDPSLNGGLGAVLLLAALGEATGDASYAAAADALLDAAIDAASELERPGIALYGTPVGVAWVDASLRPSDEESDVDVFVANVLDRPSWPWPNDLMAGLAGVGAYCLARLPGPRARRSLERVVAHLASTAREEATGLTWAYVPAPEAMAFNEHRPEGHVNLGFAHGVPGILAFLAAASAAGVAGARELLGPAVRWFLAQRLPPGAGASYASFVFPDRESETARLAWCYGDPGIAVALHAAGEALGDGEVTAFARDVALGCAGRDDDVDATLCHGSPGLGHAFNRLGQALGEERLLDLARRWYAVTLDRHLPALLSDGVAGGAFVVDPGNGLLFGRAGAALALVAAASDAAPWWDAALYVTPPGGHAAP